MQYNRYLIAGAVASALASLLHLLSIAFGAPGYRLLGAGERFAQLAEAGSWTPALVTLCIAAMLAQWCAYALSGAGVIRALPYTRLALCAIAAVYCFRGLAFPSLIIFFPDNSTAFWLTSSAISFGIGLLHVFGLRQVWWQL